MSEYRCFVGGLAWATGEERLTEAFSKFGSITDARVIEMILYFSRKQKSLSVFFFFRRLYPTEKPAAQGVLVSLHILMKKP